MKQSVLLFISVLVFLSVVSSGRAQEEKLILKTFDVLASFMERTETVRAELASSKNQKKGDGFVGMGPGGASQRDMDIQSVFSTFGVTWPEGSYIKHVPAIGKILAKNTPKNMEIIEAALAELNVIPFQIEVEIQFIEFEMKDIDKLSQEGMISEESLHALHRKGKARLISAPRVVTQSGEEATVKGVTEYIYPTEFDITHPLKSGTNTVGYVTTPGVEPGSFETREVGAILSLIPTVSYEGRMINLVLAPEHVLAPEWKDYGPVVDDARGKPQKTTMEQPFFHTYTVNTQVVMKDGSTVLVGGGLNSRDGKSVVYMFVTAQLVGMDGKRIHPPTLPVDKR